MTPKELLQFMEVLARLKDAPRHCKTPGGIDETVAAHSWRIAVMALLMEDSVPGVDIDKVIRMCLIHDFGEAITGDIPSFLKTAENEETENTLLRKFVSTLPAQEAGRLNALYDEMDAQQTPEARLYRVLDKLEAVISHNESDIRTWIPLEYELNRTYAIDVAAQFPFTKALRAQMLADTEEKIQAYGGMPEKEGA